MYWIALKLYGLPLYLFRKQIAALLPTINQRDLYNIKYSSKNNIRAPLFIYSKALLLRLPDNT